MTHAQSSNLLAFGNRLRTLIFITLLLPLVAQDGFAGQTARELVESPPLPPAPDMAEWDYFSRYFVNNVYKVIERGKYPLAPGFIEKATQKHGDNIRVRQLAVHIYMRLRNWKLADEHLTALLRLRPDATAALVRRAFVREKLGLVRKARADYQIVLLRQPSSQLKAYVENGMSRIAAIREDNNPDDFPDDEEFLRNPVAANSEGE